MEDELKEILASQQVPAYLSISYSDMHGLWGGSTLTVHGDGWLERQVRPPGAPAPTGSNKKISEREVLELLRLLVELSAWEQHAPDAAPVPDESRSQLSISLGGNNSLIWERFNDMHANDRLIRVKCWIENRFGDDARNVPAP